MKQLTQKEFTDRIEKYIYNLPYSERNRWTRRDCSYVGGVYKKHLWYLKDVLSTFPDASVYFDSNAIYVEYGTGSAKICTSALERDIFLPEVEKLLTGFKKQLVNIQSSVAA